MNILIITIFIIIFFFIINRNKYLYVCEYYDQNKGTMKIDKLDNNNDDFNIYNFPCHINCCNNYQNQDQEQNKYVGNPYTCSNLYSGSGCLCMNSKQIEYINSRGNVV